MVRALPRLATFEALGGRAQSDVLDLSPFTGTRLPCGQRVVQKQRPSVSRMLAGGERRQAHRCRSVPGGGESENRGVRHFRRQDCSLEADAKAGSFMTLKGRSAYLTYVESGVGSLTLVVACSLSDSRAIQR